MHLYNAESGVFLTRESDIKTSRRSNGYTIHIYTVYFFKKSEIHKDCEYLFWYYSLCLLEKKDMSNLKFV